MLYKAPAIFPSVFEAICLAKAAKGGTAFPSSSNTNLFPAGLFGFIFNFFLVTLVGLKKQRYMRNTGERVFNHTIVANKLQHTYRSAPFILGASCSSSLPLFFVRSLSSGVSRLILICLAIALQKTQY